MNNNKWGFLGMWILVTIMFGIIVYSFATAVVEEVDNRHNNYQHIMDKLNEHYE